VSPRKETVELHALNEKNVRDRPNPGHQIRVTNRERVGKKSTDKDFVAKQDRTVTLSDSEEAGSQKGEGRELPRN